MSKPLFSLGQKQAEGETYSEPRFDRFLKGVFSLKTGKKPVFVYAVQRFDGKVVLQQLNHLFIPAGPKRAIEREELLRDYIPDPALYAEKVAPLMRRVESAVDKADSYRLTQDLDDAEAAYKQALSVDEDHARATFGLGLTYLKRGDLAEAELVFRRLAAMDATLEPEHKHLFNEFGIALRKNRMHRIALKYYARAFKVSKNDEHLFYNMARAWFGMGKVKQTARFLEKALAIKPDFPEARKFLDYVQAAAPDGGRLRRHSVDAKRYDLDSPR